MIEEKKDPVEEGAYKNSVGNNIMQNMSRGTKGD
jgi:hypothetical protein